MAQKQHRCYYNKTLKFIIFEYAKKQNSRMNGLAVVSQKQMEKARAVPGRG